MSKIRSPLFYVGDKYKLMPQLKNLFPKNINNFYDVFSGGGSASINTSANSYFINDIDSKVMELHELLQDESDDIQEFINEMYGLIKYYNLSHSEFGLNNEIQALKKEYKKTYFSKYNKENYLKLRSDYNDDQSNKKLLYLLLVYGFNHMIRFNNKGDFNLPVGNVDWNKNVTKALFSYSEWSNNSEVMLSNLDFEFFVESQQIKKDDFFYFDPPYLITFSGYNRFWNEKEELRLYSLLDRLDKYGVSWGLSNMTQHKGKFNHLLLNWAEKYKKYEIQSNYISRFDNSIKKGSKELYVTNFTENAKQLNFFE